MTKQERVDDLLKLWDILENHTQKIYNILEQHNLSYIGNRAFLEEEYEWVYKKFEDPEILCNDDDEDMVIFDYLRNHDVEILAKLLKDEEV